MPQSRDERLWNEDLINIIRQRLQLNNQFEVGKLKVLKDIFLNRNIDGNNKLQLGFVEQDVVIYNETLNINNFYQMNNLLVHNFGNNEMIIPKIICELKYNGITSHGLITYSNYASDIKSIFPHCKYILVLRYRNTSTPNKLLRHGKIFDKIIYLDDGSSANPYTEGLFQLELEQNENLQNRFTELINYFVSILTINNSYFVK